MASPTAFLIVTGSICLAVALVQAWLLVGVYSSDDSPLLKIIPGRSDLLKSHIDYLMMSQFLFIFFLMYRGLDISPPAWVIAATCIGAFFNPFAFFVRALRPSFLKAPPVPFTIMITVSCILTTVGFGVTLWKFAQAAMALI